MDDGEAEGAKEEIETVKALIMEERYKDASECIQMAMEIYPEDDLIKEDGFGILIISETLRYADIYLPKCGDFDYYTVLHLSPYSTQTEVKKRCNDLMKELIRLKNIRFPGAIAADSKLFFAKANLCCKRMRTSFDSNRNDCVLLDWPRCINNKTTTPSSSSSLRESYLDWKPPIYRVDATMDAESWTKFQLDKEEREEGEEGYASLSPELRILKRKVFEEMPLEKYSRKVVKK